MTHRSQRKQQRIILLAGYHRLDQGSSEPKLLPQSPAIAHRSVPNHLFHLINHIRKSKYTYGWYSASGENHDMRAKQGMDNRFN
jgi:hypothetical protein